MPERFQRLRLLLGLYDVRLDRAVIQKELGYSEAYLPLLLHRLRRVYGKSLIHVRWLHPLGLGIAVVKLREEASCINNVLSRLQYVRTETLEGSRIIMLYLPDGVRDDVLDELGRCGVGEEDIDYVRAVPVYPGQEEAVVHGGVGQPELIDDRVRLVLPLFYHILDVDPLAPLKSICAFTVNRVRELAARTYVSSTTVAELYKRLSGSGLLGRVYVPLQPDGALLYMSMDGSCAQEFYELVASEYVAPEIYVGSQVHAFVESTPSLLRKISRALSRCKPQYSIILSITRKPVPLLQPAPAAPGNASTEEVLRARPAGVGDPRRLGHHPP